MIFENIKDFIMTTFFPDRITFFKVKINNTEIKNKKIYTENTDFKVEKPIIKENRRKTAGGIDYIEPQLLIDHYPYPFSNSPLEHKKRKFEMKYNVELIENQDNFTYFYIKNGKKHEICQECLLDMD
jgi:hypothetical protein